MDRALLHKDKLESFKLWLDFKGCEHRPGRGQWQLLQVKHGAGWQAIFSRADMPEHTTVPAPLVPLVRAFIRETREELKPPPGYTAEELERDNPFNAWMQDHEV